jgi:hypothetical protein
MTAVHVTGGVLEVETAGGGGSPPSVWPGPGVPTPPIYLPPPPPGIWPPPVSIWPPSPLPPDYPMPPGSIWPPVVGGGPVYPGRPTHPIAPGGRPPGIWGGAPGYPDQGLPPQPGHPDQGLPGDQPHPDHGLPGQPPMVWPPGGRPGHDLPSQKFLVAICAISAAGGLTVIGYTVVDPSLNIWGGAPSYPDNTLPPVHGHPDQGLPPTEPEPRRG